jgi:glutamate synthase (NADPH/NADH) small chain
VRDAIDFIAELRQAPDRTTVAVGRRVVVIGGGNTAIDAATQARLLGAEDATIVYRRGREQMSATPKEQDWAQINGVRIRHWAAPARIIGRNGAVAGVTFSRTDAGAAGETYVLDADMVLKAVGQVFDPRPLAGSEAPALAGGRIVVDAERRTSLADVYAGGDCVPGEDLTVSAVQDGKIAAHAIHRQLTR